MTATVAHSTMMKQAFFAALIFVLTGCATTFPTNPTPDELNEMHELMNECLDEIIPLEKRYSKTCRNVEDALIAYYGSLNAFMDAQKAFYIDK
jgi:hypothetical protein